MIWVATESGLNRYDGVKFTGYKSSDEDPTSISHNIVRAVFEDSEGHLFVCTHLGIQMFDRASETFGPLATGPDGSNYGNFNNIIQRRNGDVWACGNVLAQLSVEDGIPLLEPLRLPIPTKLTERVFEDSRECIWLCVFGDGLYRMTEGGSVSHFFFGSSEINVVDIFESTDGILYVSTTDNRVYEYDSLANDFVLAISEEATGSQVKDFLDTPDGMLLYGTDGKGIKIFNPSDGSISSFQLANSHFEQDKIKIHSLLMDSAGNLWMALYQKGVALLPQHRSSFFNIGHGSVTSDLIGSCCVTAIYYSSSNVLWVGTDNDGIYAVKESSGEVRHIPAGVAPSAVMGLLEDSTGKIWFGSYIGGFGYIDPKTLHLTYLDRSKSVYSFVEDNQKHIWIGSMGGGLLSYDLNTGKLDYDDNLNKDLSQWINTLYIGKDNTLYVGSFLGLYTIDLKADKLSLGELKLNGLLPQKIMEDRLGQICVATPHGLYIIDYETGETKWVSTADGLPDNALYSLEEDNYGGLWLSTGSGISRLDPFRYTATNYYSEDGILTGEFSQSVSCKNPEGGLYFGGSGGVLTFNPSNISETSKAWPVRLTAFYLYNEPIFKGDMSGHRQITDAPIYEAKEFRLSHKDNSFTLEFAPLSFDAPAGLRYSYSLDGGSRTILPRGVNNVTLTALKHGKHQFAVKSVVNDVESEDYSFIIDVAPGWWQTWWAILAFILLGLAVVLSIILQVQKRIKHDQLEEINEAKVQFFMNVSHEIRTPMSLIMGPLQKLIDTDDDEGRQKSYALINRNAQRILQLVNQMMDLRKIERGQMHLKFCPTKVSKVIDSICELFVPQAEKKHISFEYDHEGQDEMVLWLDPENFDKIVVNLLSNAFKFTPDGGKVSISLVESNGNAVITVSDSGVGIPEDEMQKIFERFYQSSTTYGKSLGTGIGLNLTKSLVEMHHGSIVARSNAPDAGTTFTVKIPLGCVHLAENEKSSELAQLSVPETREIPEMVLEPEKIERTVAKTRKRLLIVEDDDEIKQYLSDELSSDFYILTASNGKEALDILFKKSPDIVVSDVVMSEMDGYELCRRIKGNINLAHIPVVLLTAKTLDEDKIKGLDYGADAYMTKPFNVEVLRSRILNLLGTREALKASFSENKLKAEAISDVNVKAPDEKLMERIMGVINANISNPELTVEMMAAEVGLSRVHLYRKIKEMTNQTPHEFIRNARLMKAASMFAEKKHSIAEVAYSVGFTSPANFATAFKTLFGVTPSEYMQRK